MKPVRTVLGTILTATGIIFSSCTHSRPSSDSILNLPATKPTDIRSIPIHVIESTPVKKPTLPIIAPPMIEPAPMDLLQVEPPTPLSPPPPAWYPPSSDQPQRPTTPGGPPRDDLKYYHISVCSVENGFVLNI